MKIKLWCFLLPALCVAMLCGRCVQSSKAGSERWTRLSPVTHGKKAGGQPASRVGRSAPPATHPRPTLIASAKSGALTAALTTTPVTDPPTRVMPSPGKVVPGPVLPVPDPTGSRYDRWTCDDQYREAGDDEQAIRDLMAEHLDEAGKYLLYHILGSRTPIVPVKDIPRQRRRAMGIALAAADWASKDLGDSDLANRICEDYLLPNLDAAAPERWECISQETVLSTVVSVRQTAGDVEGAIDLYKWWIPKDPSRINADANRIRLAEQLDGQGRYEEAIASLQEIDDKGDCAGGKTMIRELEKKLQGQRANNGSGDAGAGGQR